MHPALKLIDKPDGGSKIPLMNITPGPSCLLDRPNSCVALVLQQHIFILG